VRIAFESGLYATTQSTRAWVVTTGTDSGIAKIVGHAKIRWGIEAPLIGVCPWNIVKDRRALVAGVPYAS
jgi:hypothetical protein